MHLHLHAPSAPIFCYCYPSRGLALGRNSPLISSHLTVRQSSEMDPFSIAAGVVGITAPTLHFVRLLVDDIQKIADAPDTIKVLRDDLASLEKTVTGLQAISDAQWRSLGIGVVDSSKTVMSTCMASCDKFRTELVRWTRHSASGGKMSWRDRALVGFFKQSHIKTLSEQLQGCKVTLSFAVSSATL